MLLLKYLHVYIGWEPAMLRYIYNRREEFQNTLTPIIESYGPSSEEPSSSSDADDDGSLDELLRKGLGFSWMRWTLIKLKKSWMQLFKICLQKYSFRYKLTIMIRVVA